MLRRLFSRKTENPAVPGCAQATAPDVGGRMEAAEAARPGPRWPRDGQPDYAACTFAVRHLSVELPARLEVKGRVHAETCLAASGAIAGVTAQLALIAHLKEKNDVAILKQLQTVRTITGGHYFFGEPFNEMLLPVSRADADGKLWSLAAGAAIVAGLHPSELPDPQQMFDRVVNTLGGRREGVPTVPGQHLPTLPVKQLLAEVWPVALMCFAGRFPDEPREYGVAGTHFWPAIAARVASGLIRQTRSAVDPRTGLIIVMEAAIYASTLTPGVLKSA